MQLLIFDAKVTNISYRTWEFESESERELIERFNATLRFVATNSGLTRYVQLLHYNQPFLTINRRIPVDGNSFSER